MRARLNSAPTPGPTAAGVRLALVRTTGVPMTLHSHAHRLALAALAALTMVAGPAAAAEALTKGKVALKSAGPLAFGPEGLLFVGDPQAAAIYAIDTGDAKPSAVAPVKVEQLGQKLAELLGTKADDLQVNDLAVNPASGKVYLSVSRGRGPDALPVILRLDAKGKVEELSLDGVPHAKTELANAATGAKRREAITGLKFVKGKLYVAGLSNEEFASTLRAVAYPFDGKVPAAGIQIYHGAHGKFETASPVRTFAPVEINGEEHILAAYTCTPLVKIPVSELKDGAKVKGTTVAELGNRNRPLDIVIYQKDGKSYALMANSARGVMKVGLEGIDKVEAIVSKINGKAGLTYETLEALKGVEHLDRLGENHAVLLVRDGGKIELQTIDLP
jgi:hypothetical protein